jgi:hypothetical protein
MENGFTQEQFAALGDSGGHPAGGAQSERIFATLQPAHYATKEWALDLQAACFPRGRVEARRAPINQGGHFAPYTWAKVYPYEQAPKELAFTVGIDQDQSFIVKIDTVNARGEIRERYEALRGPGFEGSPIAKVMSMDDGLAMSREQLVEWSAAAIRDFEYSYDDMVHLLGISPTMRLVTDRADAVAGFEKWRSTILEGALLRERRFWVPEAGIVVDPPYRGPDGRMIVAMATDPDADTRTVSIVEPLRPGTRNPLSNIAVDYRGQRFLVHQAKLSAAGANVTKEQFLTRTGLAPVAVEATGLDADRAWLVVANLDAPSTEIRQSTGRFVHYCAVARTGTAGRTSRETAERETSKLSATAQFFAPDEVGGCYIVGARPATDAQTVLRRHGIISMTLRTQLHERKIVMQKPCHPLGFETDGEILRKHAPPLLIEIKTSISAGDLHAGVGQLHIYSRLIPGLDQHKRILLLPRLPDGDVIAAIKGSGILVHEFTFVPKGNDGEVTFSDAFMAMCEATE